MRLGERCLLVFHMTTPAELGLTAEQIRPTTPGLEDVFVNLVEVAKENWSFGNGVAQYA